MRRHWLVTVRRDSGRPRENPKSWPVIGLRYRWSEAGARRCARRFDTWWGTHVTVSRLP